MSLVDEQQILQGKHVLLAEDNDLNAEIAIMILEAMGLIVERVEDGIQCVAKMEQMPAKNYDLILMDVQMPHMMVIKQRKQSENYLMKERLIFQLLL